MNNDIIDYKVGEVIAIEDLIDIKNNDNQRKDGDGKSSSPATLNIINIEKVDFSKRFVNNNHLPRFAVSFVKYNSESGIKKSPIAEVVFKCKRKQLFNNEHNLPLQVCEFVVVEVDNGIDVGTISACGLNADEKLNSQYENQNPTLKILRHVNHEDFERFIANKDEECKVIERTKSFVQKFNLDMKITDAEWQFDRKRLTIYFTAPQRIDFRSLVKELARAFKTRIELRQISTREEAKRIGGIGSCGRSLCCDSFACDFCHVTLDHARTQQLSNNVAKLSGYCGRLKCCLLYEYDHYVEAFKKYPPLDSLIDLPEGLARIVKADIFKNIIYTHVASAGVYKALSFEELTNLREQGKVISPPKAVVEPLAPPVSDIEDEYLI